MSVENANTWSAELIAQFPLPDNYEWNGGSYDTLPHLNTLGPNGKDAQWVYNYAVKQVMVYKPHSAYVSDIYLVSSPEEAIALIYNLALFGETP